ncbi:hypothetical protein MKW94_022936 [Papaver nudicaule]|uniref:Uncharacterized protein n=1 Tax=Papaver nudicaule TaxID=74823 RepID=A0AA41VJ99_PAPNU|nr:hypothetical protein [Papaver nudicaule]
MSKITKNTDQKIVPRPSPLWKQKSWSPDTDRDDAWLRRKGMNKNRRRTKSVTEEDLDELKACIELGFSFDSPDVELNHRLSDTLPALGLYYATSSGSSSSSLSIPEFDPSSPRGSPHTILSPGENPQIVKTRLKQWAQVVACTLRQSC